MSLDPDHRGREVAAIFLKHAPSLFEDLVASDVWVAASGALPGAAPAALEPQGDRDPVARAPQGDAIARARREWDAFALYACVRGLVAGGGFNRETAASIEVLHETVAAHWRSEFRDEAAESAHISKRYAEYGEIGQAGGKSGAESVTLRLGAAAARHMLGDKPGDDPGTVAELVGALHESLAESVTEYVRRG